MDTCSKCAATLVDQDAVCPACGATIESPERLAADTSVGRTVVDLTAKSNVSMTSIGEFLAKKNLKTFGVVGAAIVLAVGTFTVFRGGTGSVTAASNYSGANKELVYLAQFDRDGFTDSWAFTKLGSEERPTEISDGRFWPARLLSSGQNLLEVGGPMLGVRSENDELQVISVEANSGEATVLLDGGDDYAVFYDSDRNLVNVVEVRPSGQRCYSGKVEDRLERIVNSDECSFSPDGRFVISLEYQGSDVEYEVLEIDGSRVLKGDSVHTPILTATGSMLVALDGSADRYSAKLIDIKSREVIAESERGTDVQILDSNRSGDVLVLSVDDRGTRTLEVLSEDGTVTRVSKNGGPLSASFVHEAKSDVVVLVSTSSGQELRVASFESNGAVNLETVAEGDYLSFSVLENGRRAGDLIAVSEMDGDTDAVMFIATTSGMIEVDLDNHAGLSQVVRASSSARIFALVTTYTSDGDKVMSVLTVDLSTGEYELLLEDWASLMIRDVRADGTGLVVTGREDRRDHDLQVVAISIEGAPEFIDDAEGVGDARYLNDQNIVMYTSSNSDGGVSTYQYKIGSRTQPTLLFEDSAVRHAGWDAIGEPAKFIQR